MNTSDQTHWDVIVVGAGAAGLMCAAVAGQRGRRVLVLEKSKAVGEKIRISGGGRCNFTNLHAGPGNFLSHNPQFCVSALRRFDQHDFVGWVERHGIAYHEKTLGQLFCDGSSKQIINMLLAECARGQVEVRTQTEVAAIQKTDPGFAVRLMDGQGLKCQSLVIATGGPSIPKMGATGWGYDVAKQFGLPLIAPRPALVPFTLTGEMLTLAQSLAGVATDTVVDCNAGRFREAMLFTHRGLSGPAILQISSYWQPGQAVTVNLMPDLEALAWLKAKRQSHPKHDLVTTLAEVLPKRLAQAVADLAGVQGRLADLSNAALGQVADHLAQWQITPQGTEGYRTAEVTLGGVDTCALSSKTMEVRNVPGLYFIGEVVDVTGHLGGFNFQWAWSSGHAAGEWV